MPRRWRSSPYLRRSAPLLWRLPESRPREKRVRQAVDRAVVSFLRARRIASIAAGQQTDDPSREATPDPQPPSELCAHLQRDAP
jgi:hypothetical protein